jgi:hypothetical protein
MRREEKERLRKEREAAGPNGRTPGEERGARREAGSGSDRREEEGYSQPESSAQKKPRE